MPSVAKTEETFHLLRERETETEREGKDGRKEDKKKKVDLIWTDMRLFTIFYLLYSLV